MSQHEATIERLKAQAEDEKDEQVEEEVLEEEDGAPKGASAIREYVVLRKWDEAAIVQAGSAEAALKILGKEDGEYAVIPSRNFSKFTIKTETTTVTHVKPA